MDKQPIQPSESNCITLPQENLGIAKEFSASAAIRVYTYRVDWVHPMQTINEADFRDGVRQGLDTLEDSYNLRFAETASNNPSIRIASFNTCHNGGATYLVRPGWCYPWGPAIYFAAWDTRPRSARTIRGIMMHELLHWIRGDSYHSPDPKCSLHINANAQEYCPSEDALLAQVFGRRPVPLPSITIADQQIQRPGTMQFVAKLSHAYHRNVTVEAVTVPRSASPEQGDYRWNGKRLTFRPGDTEHPFFVRVWPGIRDIGKGVQFRVHLSNPVNATAGRGLGNEFARGFILP